MTRSPTEISTKHLDDLLVASIRFRGTYEQVAGYLDRLVQQAGPAIDGPPVLLHHYFDEEVGEGHDLEICCPVRQAVEAGDVSSRMLAGGWALSAVCAGPRREDDAAGSIDAAWQELFAYLRQHGAILDPGPRREVYLEDRQRAGSGAADQVTELQLPLAFFRLERLGEGLKRLGGQAAAQQVMGGSQEYSTRSVQENAQWFRTAMERLDVAIDDEGARREIMSNCADRFPPHRIQALRAEYQRSGDIDELLQTMRADRTLGDLSWYEQPVRHGNVVYVTKDPVHPEAYAKATDKLEKRSWYCHCGLMRDLIRSGETVSGTYCHCGAGWYHQLWEGILGEPVRIDVVESVLQGDDRCTFAIHLPEPA